MVDKYVMGTVRKLNSIADELGLTDFQVNREPSEDGHEFIVVKKREMPSAIFGDQRHFGYGVGTTNEINQQQLMMAEHSLDGFLKGANFALEFYGFKGSSFEQFKKLANNFRQVELYSQVNSYEEKRVNNFLWEHMQLVHFLANFSSSLCKAFNKFLKVELSVVPDTSGNEYLHIKPLVDKTPENDEILDKFFKEYWTPRVKEIENLAFMSY